MIFQDFPGPGIFKKKIPDFPGGMGTLMILQHGTHSKKHPYKICAQFRKRLESPFHCLTLQCLWTSVLHLRVLSYVKGTLQIHDDIDNDNNNIQDDIYSAVIMTTRSL